MPPCTQPVESVRCPCVFVRRIGAAYPDFTRRSASAVSGGEIMLRSVARALLCVATVFAAIPALGQQFTGGVRGAVRDANGVIPGATVTLTNEATNSSREVVTNDVGQYNFPAVPPGTYTLRSQISGYKRFESKGLVVGTQQFV